MIEIVRGDMITSLYRLVQTTTRPAGGAGIGDTP